ncbi:MAG: hypothetical protein WCA78_13315 [Rhizomicrobium sp.]
MKNALLATCAVVALSMTGAQAETLTQFFGTSDLTALAKDTMVLNLEAQSATKTAQTDVNAFDDFFLINGTGKLVVNFDSALHNKGEVAIPGWIGVARYSNHMIKSDIQAGYEAVKAKYKLTSPLGHVTIYKTLNTSQLVYDYAVEQSPGDTVCQEYLYVPAKHAFQVGMTVGCYWTLENFRPHGFGSVGKPK